jgi:putative transposase
MCQLALVSRAGYYRYVAVEEPEAEDMTVRDAIQKVALEHRRRYGYRRIAKELRRRGMVVNHKRVLALLRQDNLLAIRHRKFVITTDSQHELKVYFNLAARMELTAINQLWVAWPEAKTNCRPYPLARSEGDWRPYPLARSEGELASLSSDKACCASSPVVKGRLSSSPVVITYIRLQVEFVYLAVVIDRFSRRVVGWSLERTLAARLAVAALQQAIAQRQPGPGLVHHSDRGFQYASREYVDLLQAHRMEPSMSRPANPYDKWNLDAARLGSSRLPQRAAPL